MLAEQGRARMAYAIGALALILAALIPAGASRAQSAPTPEAELEDASAEISEGIRLLEQKFAELAESMGVETLPSANWDAYGQALTEAMPVLPTADTRSWASGFQYDFTTNETDADALEPDAEGRTVLGDASGCVRPDRTGRVVHFRRIREGDIVGHHCVVALTDTEAWVLESTAFAESPQRRMSARIAVATVVEDDVEAARQLGETKVEAHVAASTLITDYALRLLAEAPETAPD